MLELVSEEDEMISSSVGSAFSDLMEADRALFFKNQSRIDPANVKQCLDELGFFEQIDKEGPVATSRVQGLIAYEGGKANLPFPLIETLSCAYVLSHSKGSTANFSGSIWAMPSLNVELDALPLFDGSLLTGTAKAVPFSALSQRIVVPAQQAGAGVFVVVDARAGKARIRHSVEHDYPVSDLTFDGAACELVQLNDSAGEASAHDRVALNSSLIAAAEMAGASAQLFDMTKEYLLSREQFGSVLATNQALKHRMAEHFVGIRSLEMLISYAAAALDAGSDEAASLVHAAKSLAGSVGKETAEDMLQLHGAIAYTTEYPLHLYLRRILRLSASFGSTYEQNEDLFQEFQKSKSV